MFDVDGRCLDVAIDHGLFDEVTFLPGIEDIGRAVRTVVDAGPDAIQLTVGQAHHLQAIPKRDKPALVLRTDVANVYGGELPTRTYSALVEDAVAFALRLDAVCVVVNVFLIPGQSELHEQCVRNVLHLKPRCEEYGVPLMVEPLAMKPRVTGGGLQVDGDPARIAALVRQAVELGADIIKADPTDDPDEYGRIIEVAGTCPVLVRGGGRVPDVELLDRTHRIMRAGARGVVYGRNIVQHPSPQAITTALMAVVHRGATPAEALELIEDAPAATRRA